MYGTLYGRGLDSHECPTPTPPYPPYSPTTAVLLARRPPRSLSHGNPQQRWSMEGLYSARPTSDST